MGIKGKVWPQILLSPVGGETSAHYQFGVCLLKMVTLVCRNILILTARFEGTNPGFSKHFYVYNLLCSLQKSCEVGSGNATVILSVFRWEPKAWELNPSAWRDRWDLGPLLLSPVFCVSCLLATWPPCASYWSCGSEVAWSFLLREVRQSRLPLSFSVFILAF